MDISSLKKLREQSGASLSDCKKALSDADGVLEMALKVLQRAGTTQQEKKQMISRFQKTKLEGARLGFGRKGTLMFADPWAVDDFCNAFINMGKKRSTFRYLNFIPLLPFGLDEVEAGQEIPVFFGRTIDITLESGQSHGQLETLRQSKETFGKAIDELPWCELAVYVDVSSFEQETRLWLMSPPEHPTEIIFGSIASQDRELVPGATVRGVVNLPTMVTKRLGTEECDDVHVVPRSVHAIDVASIQGGDAKMMELDPESIDTFSKQLITMLGTDHTPAYIALAPNVYQALVEGIELADEVEEGELDDHIGFSEGTFGCMVAGRPIPVRTLKEALAIRDAVERHANELALPLTVFPDCDLQRVKRASEEIFGTLIVGMEITTCEASQEAQGSTCWDWGVSVSAERMGWALDDAKKIPKNLFEQLSALGNGKAGELQVYLTSCGPLASAWIEFPNGTRKQVSAEGSSYLAIDPADGTCQIAAQYD